MSNAISVDKKHVVDSNREQIVFVSDLTRFADVLLLLLGPTIFFHLVILPTGRISVSEISL